MRVLIVEDDPAIVRFLERGLAAHGYQAVTADNGQEGVILAAEESVDFVLLDIMLPGGPETHPGEASQLTGPDVDRP
jgi:DNA-binding response OmpR family regulator